MLEICSKEVAWQVVLLGRTLRPDRGLPLEELLELLELLEELLELLEELFELLEQAAMANTQYENSINVRPRII